MLQPQIEAIAEQYGFKDHSQRRYWNLPPEHSATRGHEVPFIFSKHSVVLSWTWYVWYHWCCVRLRRLETGCDNHSTTRYRDEPESRRKLNPEQFMCTLLHLHTSRLAADWDASRHSEGKDLSARDVGGFDPVCNLRNPLSLSVAHKTHGAVMHTGYPVWCEFPVEQGEEAFDHGRCNIQLEACITNVARWSANDDSEMQATLDQFLDLRVNEDNFLPEAP